MSNRYGTHGAAHRFFKRHHDVSLDIAPALWPHVFRRKPAARAGAMTSSPAKELFEKVAETSAAELKFEVLSRFATPAELSPAAERLPSRRRPEF
jgi:hypothetical protein